MVIETWRKILDLFEDFEDIFNRDTEILLWRFFYRDTFKDIKNLIEIFVRNIEEIKKTIFFN